MKKQILICDDEIGILESYKLILETDYDLTLAKDGLEAIERFKAKAFDLVILDLKLPKKDGMEVLKEIKKINPASNILVITGYQSVSLAEKAINLGASNYLTKPFEKEQLLKTVRESL
jgi:DNA-binding NtrC family response regulator